MSKSSQAVEYVQYRVTDKTPNTLGEHGHIQDGETGVGPVSDDVEDVVDAGLVDTLEQMGHVEDVETVDLDDTDYSEADFGVNGDDVADDADTGAEEDASDTADAAEMRRFLENEFASHGVERDVFIDVEDGEKRSYNHDVKPADAVTGNYGVYAEAETQVVLVDIDDYDGCDEGGLDAIRSLPDTYTEVSPHGGEHLIYVVEASDPVAEVFEDEFGVKNPAPSWGEIRVANQYIVAAGSQLDGCGKEWCDECEKEAGGFYDIPGDEPVGVASVPVDEMIDAIRSDEQYDSEAERGGENDADESESDDPETPDIDTGDVDVDGRLEYARFVDEKLDSLAREASSPGDSTDRSDVECSLATKLGSWFVGDEQAVRGAMDKIGADKWDERDDGSYRDAVLKHVDEYPSASVDDTQSDAEAWEVWRSKAEDGEEVGELPYHALRFVAVKTGVARLADLEYDDEAGFYRFGVSGLYDTTLSVVEGMGLEHGRDRVRERSEDTAGDDREIDERVEDLKPAVAQDVDLDYPVYDVDGETYEVHCVPTAHGEVTVYVVGEYGDVLGVCSGVEFAVSDGESGNDLASKDKVQPRVNTLIESSDGDLSGIDKDPLTGTLLEIGADMQGQEFIKEARGPVLESLIDRTKGNPVCYPYSGDGEDTYWEVEMEPDPREPSIGAREFSFTREQMNGGVGGFKDAYLGMFLKKIDMSDEAWAALTEHWTETHELKDMRVSDDEAAARDRFKSRVSGLDIYESNPEGAAEWDSTKPVGLYIEDYESRDTGEVRDVVVVGSSWANQWSKDHASEVDSLPSKLHGHGTLVESPNTARGFVRKHCGQKQVWVLNAAELDIDPEQDVIDMADIKEQEQAGDY